MKEKKQIIIVRPGEFRLIGQAIRLIGAKDIKFTLGESFITWESGPAHGQIEIQNDTEKLDYKVGSWWVVYCSKVIAFSRLIPDKTLQWESIWDGQMVAPEAQANRDVKNSIPKMYFTFGYKAMTMVLSHEHSLYEVCVDAEYCNDGSTGVD